jgi:hypothetical protein
MSDRDPVSKFARSLHNLPHEVLLAIITRVEYTPSNLSALYVTNHLFHDLMVTYRAGLIKDIAQKQFPLESAITTLASPSQTWLRDLGVQRKWINHILEASEGVGPRSLDPDWQSDDKHNQWASIGMHLGAYLGIQYYAKMEGGLAAAVARLRSAIRTLPTTLLLHLHFASFILAEIVTRRIDFDPDDPPIPSESSPIIRTTTELTLCSSGYGSFWYMWVDCRTVNDVAPTLLQQAKTDAKKTFIVLLKAAIDHNAQVGLLDLGVGLQKEVKQRLRQEVVSLRGLTNPNQKIWTAKELDLAVIKALRNETLSDRAVARMLTDLQQIRGEVAT